MIRRLFTVAAALRTVLRRMTGMTTVGVRIIVQDADGRVLLVRHAYGKPLWHLPGGGVKRREALPLAALRELKEETGIDVPGGPDGLDLFGTYSHLGGGRSDHITVFVARDWHGDGHHHSREIAEARFVDPAHPPAGVARGSAARLAELRGEPRHFLW